MDLVTLIVKLVQSLEGAGGGNDAARQRATDQERERWARQLQQVGQPPALPVRVRQPQQQQQQRPLPPVPRRQPPPPPVAPQRVADPAPTRAAQAPSSPATATAPAIARWMRPGTLRSQFMLTEILKPPLALRPPREP